MNLKGKYYSWRLKQTKKAIGKTEETLAHYEKLKRIYGDNLRGYITTAKPYPSPQIIGLLTFYDPCVAEEDALKELINKQSKLIKKLNISPINNK